MENDMKYGTEDSCQSYAPSAAGRASDSNNNKLGWHKFLIYFGLFAAGGICMIQGILQGISTIFGIDLFNIVFVSDYRKWVIMSIQRGSYGGGIFKFFHIDSISGSEVIELFCWLFGLLLGLVLIVNGIFAIYVRFSLAGFRKNAPRLLCIFFTACGGISLLKGILAIISTIRMFGYYYMGLGWSPDFLLRMAPQVLKSVGGAALSIAIAAIMIFVNRWYYSSRKALFRF